MVVKEIETRCSIRQFSNKKIPDLDILQIVEAGRLAPSWMNVQPWHFIITNNQKQKNLLSQCANFQKQIKEASHIVVVLGDFTAWNNKNFGAILSEKGLPKEGIDHILSDKGYNPAKNTEEILLARTMEQCSYAISFMDLQAESLGISACIIGAFANELTGFNPELKNAVRKEFNIPEGMIIAGMLALGYRKDGVKTPEKKRKAFESVVSFEKYDTERI